MAADKQESRFHREILSRRLFFWIFWYGSHWGLFAYGWIKQAQDPRLSLLNGLKYSVWISRGAGLVLAYDCGLILLPMCRTILRVVRPKIRWLPLDESQWFHRQCAYSLLFFTIVHTTAHYVNFFNVEKLQARPLTALQIHYGDAGGITGHIMLLCMLLMYTTAHHKIRNQSFEVFWYTHHLALIFFLGLYTHATGCFVRDTDTKTPISPFAGKRFWDHCIGYQSWRFTLAPGVIYFIERVYRMIRARRETQITKVIRHPYNAIEIQFKKPSMKYKAGQWLFLNVPSISRFQWHPFTITSCPSDPYISVHVRQVGDFTTDLGEALGAGKNSKAMELANMDPTAMFEIALRNGAQMPALRIDGPYGAPAEDVFENEIAVLIGTGIGVTPWASILKSIWHKRQGPNPPTRLRRVEFIWVCKEVSSFEWFHTLLSSLERQSQTPGFSADADFLRIHIYLTAKLDIDTAQNIVLNSVGAELDPLTELRSRTNFGRPDFKRLFGAMRDGILDQSYISGLDHSLKTKVGVYFCGPNVAARSVKLACRSVSSETVQFSFWKEHF
ncbi:hypothetical protein TWF281_002007 [Arthrobotrys megalospora]